MLHPLHEKAIKYKDMKKVWVCTDAPQMFSDISIGTQIHNSSGGESQYSPAYLTEGKPFSTVADFIKSPHFGPAYSWNANDLHWQQVIPVFSCLQAFED